MYDSAFIFIFYRFSDDIDLESFGKKKKKKKNRDTMDMEDLEEALPDDDGVSNLPFCIIFYQCKKPYELQNHEMWIKNN